jgi:hypothetical protein
MHRITAILEGTTYTFTCCCGQSLYRGPDESLGEAAEEVHYRTMLNPAHAPSDVAWRAATAAQAKPKRDWTGFKEGAVFGLLFFWLRES